MIALAFALVLWQAPAAQVPVTTRPPTVGDTIRVVRTVPVAPRQTVHTGAWQPPDPIEAVGPPEITVRGGTVEIAYPITVWKAGDHRIEIPGPLVLGPGSKVDSLGPYDTVLSIRSVLPAAVPDSTVRPQPRAAFVPRRITSWWPLVVLWALAVLLLLPLHWWWRRRGKPRPVPAPTLGALAPPVERWAEAGETRTVVTLAVARLRSAMHRAPGAAESDPAIHELLAVLDRARFGVVTDEDALTLFRRASTMAERIGGAAS